MKSTSETKYPLLHKLQEAAHSGDAAFVIESGENRGGAQIENGDVVAAHAGQLTGNGALLNLLHWQTFSITQSEINQNIERNVSLSLKDVERNLQLFPSMTLDPTGDLDDGKRLYKAVQLIHQFNYKAAFALLTEILKIDRYNYLAWLWTSRLLLKHDSITKSIAEAVKWGGHIPEIIAEKNRIRLGIYKLETGSVKRCQFCWTILTIDEQFCPYCKSLQEITLHPNTLNPRKNAIMQAANRYVAALKEDKSNIRIASALALAFYNVDELSTALQYIQYMHRLVPGDARCQQDLATIKDLLAQKNAKLQETEPAAQVENRPAKPATQSTELPAHSSDSSKTDGTGPKILVVEDSPTAQKVIKMVLAREGYTIIAASTGDEALLRAKENAPHLVLLDVMLPDTTGYDVLEKLRENEDFEDTPVIMLTGRKGALDRARGISAGTSDYLTKPFDPKKLISTINRYIKK